MSTNSTISVIQKNGSVKSVYCHWDGYTEGVGKDLINHFNTERLANKLISEGSISSIDKSYVDTYHSKRGEDIEIMQYSSLERFKQSGESQQFNYLFKDDEWLVAPESLREFETY